jgi:hypothetical protein
MISNFEVVGMYARAPLCTPHKLQNGHPKGAHGDEAREVLLCDVGRPHGLFATCHARRKVDGT